MSEKTEKRIVIVHDAWHRLVDDFEKLGSGDGYGHMREEDIRSYLFCKIGELLRERGERLVDLHADIPLPHRRADIVLGDIDGKSWSVGVEIKRTPQHKPLTNDLDKLSVFMKEGQVEFGILVALVKRYNNWKRVFEAWDLPRKFKLEPKDKGTNNYWEVRELKDIRIGDNSFQWDSLFFVLRKV